MKKEAFPILLPLTNYEVHKGGEGKTSDNLYNCLYLSGEKLKAYGMGIEMRWGTPYGNMLVGYQPQALYICTNEEIKEGDWFLAGGLAITQATKERYPQIGISLDFINDNKYPKIIATTDSSLTILKDIENARGLLASCEKYLPSIPQSFIQKYIELYNKGEKIEKVMVEYEIDSEDAWNYNPERGEDWHTKLKLNGNEIIICKEDGQDRLLEAKCPHCGNELSAGASFNMYCLNEACKAGFALKATTIDSIREKKPYTRQEVENIATRAIEEHCQLPISSQPYNDEEKKELISKWLKTNL